MEKLVVLYPPQPDADAFKTYYVEKHIPLARKLPGLLALRYSFDVRSPAGESPYFCVFEAEFADAGAFGRAMGSPEGGMVAEDLANFAQVMPVAIHYQVD